MANDPVTSVSRPRPGDGFVQSFARGLEVIRSFSAASPEMSISEVAARTGLTRAGARRILLTLLQLGYVEQRGKNFRLSPRILDLGFAYLSSMPFWNRAEPMMERLADQTGESCSLAVLDDTEVVYVMRVHTHKILSVNLGVGSRLPAYCTSLGRVLLAGLDDAALLQRLLRSQRLANTAHTVTDLAELQRLILATRANGWALVCEELELGLVAVSAPVQDHTGRVVAALNVSGQVGRTTPVEMQNRLLPALLETAAHLSLQMGCPPARVLARLGRPGQRGGGPAY